MSLIFTSKLYREEIKHWALVSALLLWALTATTFALTNRSKTLIIGIDEAGARVITNSSDRLVKSEIKQFLSSFFSYYYNYSDQTYSEQLGNATDLMSNEAWNSNKDKLLKIQSNLKANPLVQSAEIESVDLIDQGKVEAILNLTVKAKMSVQRLKLKVTLSFQSRERTDKNPWGYEVTEVSDGIL